MKYIQKIQFLTFLLIVSSYIYCDATTTSDLQQREHAVEEFIQQELEKGTRLEMIQNELVTKSLNNSEYQALVKTRTLCKNILKQAREENCIIGFKQGISLTKTTNCQQLKKDYKTAFYQWTKYSDSYKKTPENQAIKRLKDDIDYANLIPRLVKEK